MSRLFSLATRMGRAPFVALPLAGDCPWGFVAEGGPRPVGSFRPFRPFRHPERSRRTSCPQATFVSAAAAVVLASPGRVQGVAHGSEALDEDRLRQARAPQRSPVRGRGSTAGGPFPRRAHGLRWGSLEFGDRGETLGRAPTTDRCLRQRTATSALPLREGGRRGATLPRTRAQDGRRARVAL